MLVTYKTPIWLYLDIVDFRQQIDGLVTLVADHLKQDPTSGQLFIFRNRQGDRVKLLWWESSGFWLCYKRLEKGRFKFPKIIDQAIEMTHDELNWLLSGLDFTRQPQLPRVDAKHFF